MPDIGLGFAALLDSSFFFCGSGTENLTTKKKTRLPYIF